MRCGLYSFIKANSSLKMQNEVLYNEILKKYGVSSQDILVIKECDANDNEIFGKEGCMLVIDDPIRDEKDKTH